MEVPIPADSNSHTYDDGQIVRTRAITPSPDDRVLTCTKCSHEHVSIIPEDSLFDDEMEIVIPYAAGGTTDTFVRTVGDIIDTLSNGVPLIYVNKGGGGSIEGSTAAAYFTDAGDHSHEILFALYATWYRDALGEVDIDFSKIKPVVTIADLPVAIFVKPDKFRTFRDFIDASKNRVLKVHCNMANGIDVAFRVLASKIGATFDITADKDMTTAFNKLDSGAVDCVVTLAPQYRDRVLSNDLRPLVMLGDRDYVFMADGKIRPVPNLTDYGLGNAVIDIGYFLAVSSETDEDYAQELAILMMDALLSGRACSLLRDYNYNIGRFYGERLETRIAESVSKVEALK